MLTAIGDRCEEELNALHLCCACLPSAAAPAAAAPACQPARRLLRLTGAGRRAEEAACLNPTMSLDLERFRVGSLPSLFYIPEAVGAEEEQRLLREIRASKQAWKTVSGKGRVCPPFLRHM